MAQADAINEPAARAGHAADASRCRPTAARLQIELRDTSGELVRMLTRRTRPSSSPRRATAEVGAERCRPPSTRRQSRRTGSPISVHRAGVGPRTRARSSARCWQPNAPPITRLTTPAGKARRPADASCRRCRSSLHQLTFAASEFTLPSLFESSADGRPRANRGGSPRRSRSGAGVGGYEVEVTQLANSAQRTFTFTSPAAEDTITIDGREYTLKAGRDRQGTRQPRSTPTAKRTVYAAVAQNGETIVLSSRTTGATGLEFITVTDAGRSAGRKGRHREGRPQRRIQRSTASPGTSTTQRPHRSDPGRHADARVADQRRGR